MENDTSSIIFTVHGYGPECDEANFSVCNDGILNENGVSADLISNDLSSGGICVYRVSRVFENFTSSICYRLIYKDLFCKKCFHNGMLHILISISTCMVI